MRRFRSVVLACSLVVSAALGGRAGAEGPPSSVDAGQSRLHFERGRRYFQVDEYRKAIEEFKAAHVEKPDAAFLYDIAECHRRLGEPTEALVFFRRFMALSASNDPARSIARKRIAELESKRSAPAPASDPAGALAQPEGPPAGVAPPLVAPPPVTPPPLVAPAIVQQAAPPPAAPAPFYKRAWFLTTVAAVVVAGAVGTWAIASRGGTDIPGTPLGNQRAFP
jgi:tetratricopeptide (TPR) repeat protein